VLLRFFQKAAAELLGTYAIVFFGCGSVMVMERFPGSVASSSIPLVFGLVVTCMVYAVGHISGAHLNPAVTLAFSIARHFPLKNLPFYWVSQFLGAILASATLGALLPPGNNYGMTLPALTVSQSLGVETLLSFFLMFVVIAVATDTRAEGTMAGVAVGGVVAICAYLGGPLTGASMNPARSFGPAIISGNLAHLWIYFVGPCFGMVFAALTYEWMRFHPTKINSKTKLKK
jgi:MIP family channel proteins